MVRDDESLSIQHNGLLDHRRTNGLGLSIARYFADSGAGHLILVSRSGIKSESIRVEIEAMRQSGTQVTVLSTDVGDAESLNASLSTVRDGGLPLRGVIHCAVVVEDALLSDLSNSPFTSFIPKSAAPRLGWSHATTRLISLLPSPPYQ